MFYYALTSTVAAPETLGSGPKQDEFWTQSAKRRILRSKRPSGTYHLVRWPAGEPWNKTRIAMITK